MSVKSQQGLIATQSQVNTINNEVNGLGSYIVVPTDVTMPLQLLGDGVTSQTIQNLYVPVGTWICETTFAVSSDNTVDVTWGGIYIEKAGVGYNDYLNEFLINVTTANGTGGIFTFTETQVIPKTNSGQNLQINAFSSFDAGNNYILSVTSALTRIGY